MAALAIEEGATPVLVEVEVEVETKGDEGRQFAFIRDRVSGVHSV